LDALDEQKWQLVDEGNRVQEVNLSLPVAESARYFVIQSQERRVFEEAMRTRSMERARQALEKVAAAVEAGRLKAPAKIGARAQRALSQHHGYRYYSWEVEGRGQFRFFEDPDKLEAEMRHEGKYILKTDDAELAAVDAVAAYKELSTVEFGFRDLKDVIEGRPIFHQTDERVEAHIFVATLSLFLKRSLEHQLAAELPELSSTDAFAAMKSIGIAELSLNGQTTRLVAGGGRDARRVLTALGIKDIEPPSPGPSPKGAQK
jgi:transposase